MDSTPGKRLLEWREFKGITLAEMSRITGIRNTTLSSSEQPGSSNPSYDTISKVLAGFPDLNPDWLLLGTGPMLRDGRVLTPVVTEEAGVVHQPTPGLTSGPATVAEAENILLRELLINKDEIITMLRAELGKSNDSPDAADALPTNPRKPLGFGAAIQAALLASYAAEPVEAE
jgi:transcriptional regulator with XRE-family HTH domain